MTPEEQAKRLDVYFHMTPEQIAEETRREDEYWSMREREEFRNNPDHDDSYMDHESSSDPDQDDQA